MKDRSHDVIHLIRKHNHGVNIWNYLSKHNPTNKIDLRDKIIK